MNLEEFETELDKAFEARYRPARNFRIHDRAPIDSRTWYTVSCSYEASHWLRSQSRELWHEHINTKWEVKINNINNINNMFDIDEKLYTILALRWS